MGAVYLGRQVDLDRPIAIKVLHPEYNSDSGLNSRFRQEAKAAKSLTHPNTVRIYDFGESDDGNLFLVLEYLDGVSLDRLLAEKGKLPIPFVIRVGMQVLKSLIEAHHYGIIHRDLKPSNLMLCHQPGEPDHIKVLDFGVARLNEGASHKTATGTIVGTPHYMSPEQALAGGVTERSDLYSLGITLLELATGEVPYNDDSPFRVAMGHVQPDPVPIPTDFESTNLGRVIKKACAKKPADRFADAEEMLGALGRLNDVGIGYVSGLTPDGAAEKAQDTAETEPELSIAGLDFSATVVDEPKETSHSFNANKRFFAKLAIGVLGTAALVAAFWVIRDHQSSPDPLTAALETETGEVDETAVESSNETPQPIPVAPAPVDTHSALDTAFISAIGQSIDEVRIAAESARVVALLLAEQRLEDGSQNNEEESTESSFEGTDGNDDDSTETEPTDDIERDNPNTAQAEGVEPEATTVETGETEPDGSEPGTGDSPQINSTPYVF